MNLPDKYNYNIAIIGLGYVGLPLAVEFSKNKICNKSKKFINRKVIGFDIDIKRIKDLENCIDNTKKFLE